MWQRKASVNKSASGVSRIRRDTYATVNGFSKKNAWWEIRAKVWKRDRGLCVDCARRGLVIKGKDCHHIIALSRGGTTTMPNLVTLCETCHDRRHPHLFRARK